MVKTLEVPDEEMIEPILATYSNSPEVKLPEHVNLFFLQTTNECNLTSDIERDLKQLGLLLDHSDNFAKNSTDLVKENQRHLSLIFY